MRAAFPEPVAVTRLVLPETVLRTRVSELRPCTRLAARKVGPEVVLTIDALPFMTISVIVAGVSEALKIAAPAAVVPPFASAP
jgi:hypothetical protein